MGPFESIVVLVIVGFLMLAAEVFVPGMVLGLLGGIMPFRRRDRGVSVLRRAHRLHRFRRRLRGHRCGLLCVDGGISAYGDWEENHAAKNPFAGCRRAGVFLRSCSGRTGAPLRRSVRRARHPSEAGRWTSWRRAISSPLMSRSSWFAKRGCGPSFEKRCSRM